MVETLSEQVQTRDKASASVLHHTSSIVLRLNPTHFCSSYHEERDFGGKSVEFLSESSSISSIILPHARVEMPSALFEELALRGTKQIIPPLIYGTAWKKERTSELVYQAISSGFKGVDTAAQPKHYREDLVGDGIRRALSEGKVKRDEIFVSISPTL